MEKVIRTIDDQYGNEIPAAVLTQSKGLLRLWEVNCMSSMTHNLGNCLCVNHPPSVEDVISTEEVVTRFGEEALDGFEAPSDKQLIFNAFGIEAEELETALRVAYYFNINPLPALRKFTGRPIVFSENPDLLVFPEEEQGSIVFIVNGHGEISVRIV